MPNITSITTKHVDIPQKVVFETAKGRTEVANALNVVIEADNGLVGYGEGTAVEYVTGETRETVVCDIATVRHLLEGWNVDAWRGFCCEARQALPNRRTACAGLEMAIIDLYCKTHGIAMTSFFGGVMPFVISDLTIPISTPELAFQLAEEAACTYSSLKIKVGGKDRSEDMERVRQIHLAAPDAKLRIDANQGFSADDAVRFVRKLGDFGIVPELVEQPVPNDDIEGLRYVKEHVQPPVIADESALDPTTVMKLIKAEAVDGVNIKLMKAGITGALDIIAMVRAAGLKLMIGCMLETPVGIGIAVHLASGTGAFQYLDLDADVLGKPTGMEQNYVREGEKLTPKT